jgi:hypothetical protein
MRQNVICFQIIPSLQNNCRRIFPTELLSVNITYLYLNIKGNVIGKAIPVTGREGP